MTDVILNFLLGGDFTRPGMLVLGVLAMAGYWGIFRKCGLKGWTAFVPCLREYNLGRAANREMEGRVMAVLEGILFVLRMAQELLTNENELRTRFGYFSPYFRFPMGAYNENALELVGELGYTAVFWSAAYEDWDTEQQRGADYAFDTVTARLHPGAILLLHSVSVDNALALGRIIDHARAQGYEFRPLTAYGS